MKSEIKKHYSFRKIVKYCCFSLMPLIVLLFSLELTQRIRYSIRFKNKSWLFYCNVAKKNVNNKFIKIEKFDCEKRIKRAYSELQLSYNIKSDKYKYIACIGGSSTEGVQIESYYKYPHLLNRLINSNYIIINLGLEGKSSDAYYEAIEDLLERVSPEIIIFYCGYNDIFIKDVSKIYSTFSAKFSTVYGFLERFSLLLLTIKEKIIIHKVNSSKSYEEDFKKYKKLENEFHKNIDKCVNLLVEQNIKVILIPEVLMAKNFGGLTTNYENYAEKYANVPIILKETAKKYDCEFISLQKFFENGDFKKYFVDPVHLTKEGNKVLSNLIFKNSKSIMELKTLRK